jgi:hypothetical protein
MGRRREPVALIDNRVAITTSLKHDISSRCGRADEVQHLTGRHTEVFRHVGRYECGGAVRCDNRSRVNGGLQRKRRCDPHLPCLATEIRRELRGVGLSCGDMCDDRPAKPRR